MVPDRWYIILESREVPKDKPLGVTRFGKRLVLWRDQEGRLCCTTADCPHRGVDLAAGRIVNGCVECPFHGFQFNGEGKCTVLPAHGKDRPIPPTMKTRAFPVRERDGLVWVWYGAPRDPLPEPPWFEELDQGYVYDTLIDDWNTHYTRAIENQLDFTHLPFAHRTTIGKSLPGRLEVVTEVDGDRIKVSYDPATYDAKGFFVELLAPNLWRNRLAEGVWAIAIFVPVDEAHTRLYLRFYQRHFTLPFFGWLSCWVANWLNRFILWQDKRIVLTQRPLETAPRMGEVLVPSDKPIVEWRRWRARNLHPDEEPMSEGRRGP